MRHFSSRIRRAAKASRAADAENWQSARRIARQLDTVLKAPGPRKTAIARASGELRLSARRIYALLARYRLERAALRSRNGAARGKRLAENVEAIIAATLREKWMGTSKNIACGGTIGD